MTFWWFLLASFVHVFGQGFHGNHWGEPRLVGNRPAVFFRFGCPTVLDFPASGGDFFGRGQVSPGVLGRGLPWLAYVLEQHGFVLVANERKPPGAEL
jgi:hypothetical protein